MKIIKKIKEPIYILVLVSCFWLIPFFFLGGCTPDEAIFTSEIADTNIRFIDDNGEAYGISQVNNMPRVSTTPFNVEVAMGNLPGKENINKFGHNPTVAASLETIWSGSNLYSYMTVADQLEVLSSDVSDNVTGTGARTVDLLGLDTNFNQISETISLNGTTLVITQFEYIRIFRAIVRSAGSTGWNVGQVTFRDQDTDVTRAIVDTNNNQTLMAMYTIPAGKTGYITSWYVGTSFAKDTHLELYVRPEGEVFQIKRHTHVFRDTYQNDFDFPERVTEMSDIEIRGQASGGGGEISGGFFLWLEDN